MKNHSVLNLNRLLPLVRDNVEYQPTDLSDPRQFYHSCYQKPYILLGPCDWSNKSGKLCFFNLCNKIIFVHRAETGLLPND